MACRVFFIAVTAAATSLGAGCASLGSGGSGWKDRSNGPADGDAAVVFQSLRDARAAGNLPPTTWVGPLERLARDGALRLAQGADPKVVARDIANRAAYQLGRNASVSSFLTDSLTALEWPRYVMDRRPLLVTFGVSLMQTAAPGRYGVVMILPEAGLGLSQRH
jgi:hypothetical protein